MSDSGMVSHRQATIDSGVRLIKMGETDTFGAKRDEFAKLYLTTKGQRIYQTSNDRMSDDEIRSIVTRAVDAGY